MTSLMEVTPVEQHHEPVDAEAEAARRRQAVLEGPEVVLVDGAGLDVAGLLLALLVLEAGPLLDRVVQLAEGVAQLAAGRPPARTARPGTGSVRCVRASGETSSGWSITKTGPDEVRLDQRLVQLHAQRARARWWSS